MNEETKFFMLLAECYAADRGLATGDVVRAWDEAGATQEIYEMYPLYHTERLENAFQDIDCYIATGKHAW